MFAGSFLMCSTTVVDQGMAAMLAGGSVAALSYANKTIGLILAICATALSTATLPYFSQMVARQDWAACKHALKRFSWILVAVTVPFTLGLIAISTPLTRVLFQRGSFTGADTALVSKVQAFYAIQIPFYVCGMLFVRFLSAARRNELLMYGSAVSLLLDIGLNFELMKKLGVAGIALSTSLVYVVAFFFLGAFSIKVLSRAPLSAAVNAAPASGD
jgi:putative peptidoglycan lipid II flippase